MKPKDKYPEFVPTHGDLWALAYHYLQTFLAGDFCENFLLGTVSANTHAR